MEQQTELRLDRRDAVAALTPPARRTHLALLAGFAERGRPLSRADLERAAGELGDPGSALAELADRDVVAFDPAGEIRAAYPFSPTPTPHRVTWADGPAVYAMCAIDALGMSAMLGRPVTITSAEPDSGELVAVEVDGDRATWRPDSAVVCAGSTGDDCCPAADRTCGYINFFTTEQRAREWVDRHTDLTVTVLDESRALDYGISVFGGFMAEITPEAPVPADRPTAAT